VAAAQRFARASAPAGPPGRILLAGDETVAIAVEALKQRARPAKFVARDPAVAVDSAAA
jgi:hypothetical protein